MGVELGKILVEIDDELEMKFRELILKKFGSKRGALSEAVREAIEDWVRKEEQKGKVGVEDEASSSSGS